MLNRGLQPLCIVLAILPSVLCVLLVSFRIWTRWRGRKYGIGRLGYQFVLLLSNSLLHTLSIRQWNYANSIIYNPILALVKASFLLTLIKLQCQNKWINLCLWGTLAANACFAVGAPLACIFQCNPIARYWDSTIPGKCVDPGAYTVSTSSIVLATDVLILIMPSWMLHDLSIPLGRKLMVIAFLSFGIAVTIVGAYRTSVLVKVFVVQEVVPDPTYGVGYTLSNIESGLAIIGTCGPTIKHLLGFCFPTSKVAHESNNRNYMYPSGGSHGERWPNRSGRSYTTVENASEDYQMKRTWSRRVRSQDSSEHNSSMTKIVSWRIDPVQVDSNSPCEQDFNKPHEML
ncbi:hypothetical protein FB567DRAFT_457275 [Paraphoma chrysanthemicola]|uniref:Rhodopsin domain-containing protein n=1 Tax=Paraphoma chrysanthemicola TaxID=798071 RepID=A0A8K0QU39_9PLEO|nr:hypothetical protein FB567DRAFT_457275 [Paraphoma chrysanthemicola]